jgi:cytochrome c oxidase assembly protein subunit 16
MQGRLVGGNVVGFMADYRGVLQKLAAKDLDNWEQKRVKRLPGEHDGVL